MVLKSTVSSKHLVGLPLLVVGPVDVGRLLRELEAIESLVSKANISGRSADFKLPKTSHLMDLTTELNKLDLLDEADRQRLLELLTTVKKQAPLLHISFSADPAPAFIEKLMAWLRHEIHPILLLTIGLQPNLGAGCIVRSTNKYFDLSLRKDLLGQKQLLMSKIAGEKARS